MIAYTIIFFLIIFQSIIIKIKRCVCTDQTKPCVNYIQFKKKTVYIVVSTCHILAWNNIASTAASKRRTQHTQHKHTNGFVNISRRLFIQVLYLECIFFSFICARIQYVCTCELSCRFAYVRMYINIHNYIFVCLLDYSRIYNIPISS